MPIQQLRFPPRGRSLKKEPAVDRPRGTRGKAVFQNLQPFRDISAIFTKFYLPFSTGYNRFSVWSGFKSSVAIFKRQIRDWVGQNKSIQGAT